MILFLERKSITSPGNDPPDGCRQQPVIILDELRPNDSFSFQALLQFLGPYNLAGVHSGYHDKYPDDFDADSGRFVDDETVDNPIPQYVARQSAEAQLQISPKSVLKGLVNTCVPPVSSPQSDDCPAVEAPFMVSAPKEDANESK